MATNIIIVVALAALVFVLALGVLNMRRGGDPQRSQRLMRWRIGLQGLIVVVLLALLYYNTK